MPKILDEVAFSAPKPMLNRCHFVFFRTAFIFTARPEAQRCQVTPYVVNVVLVLVGGGSDSYIQ